MNIRSGLLLGLCLAAPSAVFADFQYDEMTRVTGGSIVSMAKFAGAFSKQARSITDPVNSTILVKGNRMARISAEKTEIIDLDAETITEIYRDKQQYTVVTFQEMKQAVEEGMKRAQQDKAKQQPAQPTSNTPPPEMKFDVKVTNTGANKDVAGLSATESILRMTMEAKDRQSGQTGNIAITNDMWMAPEIPGYSEVRDFNQRFAMKMGEMMAGAMPNFSSMMAGMQPGMMTGMSDMVKEMSKLKGVPVSQTMRMGSTADGSALPAASEAPLPKSDMPSAGDVAGQAATNAANTAANDAAYKAESNVGSHMGNFGNVATSLGGLPSFHKKKKDPPPAQQQQTPAAQPGASGTTGAANQNFAVLMESTTEMTKYSSAAVDTSRFNVPAGYTKVAADIQKKQPQQ